MEPERPTIATLPVDPYAESPPKPRVTQPVSSSVLSTVDYSDKTFIVFGDATKTYKEQMKELGGRFNGRLKERPGFPGGPGWIFLVKYKPQVFKFVNQVNEGGMSQHERIPQQGGVVTLPTVALPSRTGQFQTVKWKVYRPTKGMGVVIKAGGVKTEGTVMETETESNRNVVDTAYIDIGGNTSKLVICNGKWQVWGYMAEHSVYFNSSTLVEAEEKERAEDVVDI